MNMRRRRVAVPVPVVIAARPVLAPGERWQHGQERAAATRLLVPELVANGVWALREGDDIGDPEVVAAERFRADYTFGVEGVRDPIAGRCGGHDPHDAQIARSEAITRYREITDAIGPRLSAWLVSLVVMDWSFAAMQRAYMPGPLGARIEMRGRCTTVLILLSRMYAAIDKRAQRK